MQGADHVSEGIGKEKKNTCFEMGKGERPPFVCDNHRFEWLIEAEGQWIVTQVGLGKLIRYCLILLCS